MNAFDKAKLNDVHKYNDEVDVLIQKDAFWDWIARWPS